MHSQSTAQKPATDDWDRHWSSYEEVTRRNPAQKYRRQLLFDAVAQSDGDLRIADLGSGQGDFLVEAQARFPKAELLGIDISQVGLELAQNRVPTAHLLRHDFSRPFAIEERYRSWATHVVCSEVLEHLDAPELALCSVRPLLAPGAHLLITVPGGPMSAFDKHIGHRRHYSPNELEALLLRSGYQPVEVVGAGFPFFNAYRMSVVLKGKSLVQELDSSRAGSTDSLMLRAALQGFDWLFQFNRDRSRLGWQTFGVFQVAAS